MLRELPQDVFFGLEAHVEQDFDWKRWVANWSATAWGALRVVAPRDLLAPLDLAALRKCVGGVLNGEGGFAIRVGLDGDGARSVHS